MRFRTSLRVLPVVALGLLPVGVQDGAHVPVAGFGDEQAPQDTVTNRYRRAIAVELHEGTQLAFDVSPDGKTIVFDLLGQIWKLPATGGEATALTNAVADTAEDNDPVFSPDGSQIVFRSDRSQGVGLWLLTDEDQLRQLTQASSRYEDTSPSWAPDGRLIAFVRSNAIHILDVATGNVQRLSVDSLPRAQVRDPTWSPDGTLLAFAAGRRLWEVTSRGGVAVPVTPDGVDAVGPAYLPDGNRIAFFSRDSTQQHQVFVLDRRLGKVEQLTSHADVTPRRVRWSPDGEWLYYSADGKLWRASLRHWAPQEIPFRAVLRFDRRSHPVTPVRFAGPGSTKPARGNMGVALSPSGTRITLIALDRLWVIPVGGQPEEIARLPIGASGPSWSPDETAIVWSGGPTGAEDLFATEVATGQTRRVTALPGREDRPAWSPDGKWIAFLNWEWPEVADPPWQGFAWDSYLRVVPADGPLCSDVSETIDLGDIHPFYTGDLFVYSQEAPRWTPGSDKILVLAASDRGVEITTISLSGEHERIGTLPNAATFVSFKNDRSLVFLAGNALWQVRFDPDSGIVGEPERLSDEPAFTPSASEDGSILYLSDDGYRLRRPDGRVERLGWPLTFEVPTPEALLIRNTRIIVGNGAVPSGLHDIHIEAGRITSIAPAGTTAPDPGVRVVDAAGRTVIPGLIDAHSHLHDEVSVAALLYNGVTTFRDQGAILTRVAGVRDAIEAGTRVGSRVVFGGVKVLPGQDPDGLSGQSIQSPSDPSAMLRLLALLRALDANSVKMQWHDRLGPGTEMIGAARAAGFPVSGHCALQLAFVAAGVSGKEHIGPSCDTRSDNVPYGDVAQLLNASDIWVVPTLSVWSTSVSVLEDTTRVHEPEIAQFMTPFAHYRLLRSSPARAERYRGFLNVSRAAAQRLYHQGVQLVTGTDIPVIPTALHTELEEFVNLGMSPLEALTAATGTAAHALVAEDEIGTIEVGKWADLVILDADPLEDIRNTRKIWMVIKGGEIVDREALAAQALLITLD